MRPHPLLWVAGYLVLAGLPLLVAAAGHPVAGRGFWIEFAVGLGFVGFSMLALQFALTAKFRSISVALGLDILLHFHRVAGIIAFSFILAHLSILLVADPAYLAYLDPRESFVRAAALWAVLGALVLLLGTTLWRQRLGIGYEWWRAGHGILALVVLLIGLVHILRVGFYISVPWKQAVWVLATAVAIGLLLYARVWKPLRLRKRPWRVSELRPEAPGCWTLALRPERHAGMRFRAGQFVWLALGPSPFALQQHPFSISSSADRTNSLELTIKELGDFTRTVGRVPTGTTAFVDGPFGSFLLDADADADADGGGAVFIAGGVGITPVMSILRTLRDRGDQRTLHLLYATATVEDAIFIGELREMTSAMDLRLVHVVERPPPDWNGESGLIDDNLLARHVPEDRPDLHYLVCGPGPLMDLAERHLARRKVPVGRVTSERFQIA